MSPRTDLLRFAMEGDRVRRASAAMEAASPQLAAALRRAMPFLVRRGVQIAPCFARAVPVTDLLGDLARPFHATLLVSPTGASGALVLDAGAIALMLDGVLGGDGKTLPELQPGGLTGPQTALVSRVTDGIVRSISEVTTRRFGFALQTRPPDGDTADPQGAPIACTFEVGEGEHVGRIVLLFPKDALVAGSSERSQADTAVDARVARVIEDVEVEVVAELARQRIALGALSALKVGDMIKLDVHLDGVVALRADGHVVLRGRPMTSAGQIAIRIEGGHED